MYYELVDQVRQSDPAFQRLLNNVRIGKTTQEDIKLLAERKAATNITSKRDIKSMARGVLLLQEKDRKAVALFPTVREVRKINLTVLKMLCSKNQDKKVRNTFFDAYHLKVYTLNAVDDRSPNATRLCRLRHVHVNISADDRLTGGLEEQLHLAEGYLPTVLIKSKLKQKKLKSVL